MRSLKYTAVAVFCLLHLPSYGQTGSFELNHRRSAHIDGSLIRMLTGRYWRVYSDELEIRGQTRRTAANTSVCYYADGTFFYNGSAGSWQVADSSYIEHRLSDKQAESRLNFGGLLAVTEITDSTLVLTKVLTTSGDMRRTLRLRASSILTQTEQPQPPSLYRYSGVPDQETIDSLASMDAAALFDAGFTVLSNGTIHLLAADSLYVIKLKNRLK